MATAKSSNLHKIYEVDKKNSKRKIFIKIQTKYLRRSSKKISNFPTRDNVNYVTIATKLLMQNVDANSIIVFLPIDPIFEIW